jgi:hypothetical protein
MPSGGCGSIAAESQLLKRHLEHDLLRLAMHLQDPLPPARSVCSSVVLAPVFPASCARAACAYMVMSFLE